MQQLKKQGIIAFGKVCHTGKLEHRKKLKIWIAKFFGRIDILSLNAGVGFHIGDFLGQDEEGIDKMFSMNCKSVYLLVKELMSLLLKG